ncbi:MAG: hypothetical protein WA126_06060 [Thermodesulfovibrionales bacterium]
MDKQSKQEQKGKADIEKNIVDNFIIIKGLSDSGIALINKEGKCNEDDLLKVSDITDQIFEKFDHLRDLLFELEDFFETD